MRFLHGRSSADGTPNRLVRGHRQGGRQRWDDTIQRTTEPDVEGLWQLVRQDRSRWRELEPKFVHRQSDTRRGAARREAAARQAHDGRRLD